MRIGAYPRVDQADTLSARGISVRFGGVRAVAGLDLDVGREEILGLIGPNGAGKTTLVNVISGYQRPDEGSVTLGRHEITRWPIHRRARAGVVRSFQAVRLFANMTIGENVEAAALGSGASPKHARARVRRLLSEFDLAGDARAAGLPHGVERRVGIVRVLATEPCFVLLDEPAAGLNESEIGDFIATLREVQRSFECGLCVIDHDMQLIMNLCQRVHVMASGRTLAIGSPSEVRSNSDVVSAYLGTS